MILRPPKSTRPSTLCPYPTLFRSMIVIPTIAPFMRPRILPRLRRDYPDLKLFLREEPSGPACEGRNNGRTDCVLLALPYACGEVAARPLFDDRLFVAFPEGEEPPPPTLSPDNNEGRRPLLPAAGHCTTAQPRSSCNLPELPAPSTHTDN